MCRLAVILVALPTVLPLAACGSSRVSVPHTRSPAPVYAGSQGAGSEVVFHGVLIAVADEIAGDELSRRDAALNVREPATAFDIDSWPSAPVPALDDARYLVLPRDARTLIYFNTANPRGSQRGDLYFYWRSWE
ncbi:MAG TPA: hypothetical protein VD997_11165 [Phycisphaerales bacterium]|nr:hypothetical protein [Phycisphaerales bacterium]